MSTNLEARIAAYLAKKMPDCTDVAVDQLTRVAGGSSKETFALRARWQQQNETVQRALILRREPTSGLVNGEPDLEHTVYAALAGHGVPVPAVHYVESDEKHLDRPFFIMDLVPGKPAHFWGQGDLYEGQADAVGRNFWRHLGTLAALDHSALGLAHLRGGNAPDPSWQRELAHWETILNAGEMVVEPIVRGAIRWLRRNPPPPSPKLAVTHGDYRVGNFLFTEDGKISAILDWEMCHIGDPLEDVAWALNPMWSIERHFPLEDGLAIWEQASGIKIDYAALAWWRLFAPVKACGLWTTAEASFAEGKNPEAIVALAALRANHFHHKEILTRMRAMEIIS